jgi:hypothetical protein
MAMKRRRAKDIKAIGQFIISFSQLEFVVRALFEMLIGIPAKQAEIVLASYDFASLCRATSALAKILPEQSPDASKRFEKLINECLRINVERVRVVHGTWNVVGGSIHVSRNTFKRAEYFATYEDMMKLIEAMDDTFEEFATIIVDRDEKWGSIVRYLHEDKPIATDSQV